MTTKGTPMDLSAGLQLRKEQLAQLTLGSRSRAKQYRIQLEQVLNTGGTLELDFEGIEATQSFMDELVGILVLERGPDVLKQLKFRRCSADMKAIISFVVDDRAAQHLERQSTSATPPPRRPGLR